MTCQQAQATQVDNKCQVKRKIETQELFYQSLTSVETYSPLRGLRATQQRSALEDHEGHSSWSLFQLLFLLPLDDSFPCGGGIDRYKLSEAHHNLLGAL